MVAKMSVDDFETPDGSKATLLKAYIAQYNSATDIVDGGTEKESDRISANRAAQSALDAIAKLTGIADVRMGETVRYVVEGLPDKDPTA